MHFLSRLTLFLVVVLLLSGEVALASKKNSKNKSGNGVSNDVESEVNVKASGGEESSENETARTNMVEMSNEPKKSRELVTPSIPSHQDPKMAAILAKMKKLAEPDADDKTTVVDDSTKSTGGKAGKDSKTPTTKKEAGKKTDASKDKEVKKGKKIKKDEKTKKDETTKKDGKTDKSKERPSQPIIGSSDPVAPKTEATVGKGKSKTKATGTGSVGELQEDEISQGDEIPQEDADAEKSVKKKKGKGKTKKVKNAAGEMVEIPEEELQEGEIKDKTGPALKVPTPTPAPAAQTSDDDGKWSTGTKVAVFGSASGLAVVIIVVAFYLKNRGGKPKEALNP